MTALETKAAVRSRDDNACTDCGITAAEYQSRCRRPRLLEVHRLIPGSPYTVDGCVTLCKRCHKGRHRKQKPKASLIFFSDRETRLAILLAATKADLSTSEIINDILRKSLASEIEEAQKHLPPIPTED